MDWQTGGSNQVPRRQAEIKKAGKRRLFLYFQTRIPRNAFQNHFFYAF